jgi:hypothetical protein
VTRDDIIRMAREAGIKLPDSPFPSQGFFMLPALIGFAALVAAAEREACAEMVEGLDVQHPKYIANAIRARGQS